MGQDNLKQIKDILFDHVVSIDTDQLWAEIESKRRRGFLWIKLLLSGIALMMFVSMSYMAGQHYFNDVNTEEAIPSKNNSRSLMAIATINDQESIFQDDKEEAVIHENDLANKTLIEITEDNSAEILIKYSDEEASQTQQKTSIAGSTFNQKETERSELKQNIDYSDVVQNSNKEKNNPSVIGIDQSDLTETKHKNDFLNIASRSSNHSFAPFSALDKFSSGIQYSSRKLPKTDIIECYSYGKNHGTLFLLPYVSTDFVSSSMKVAPENEAYLLDRQNSQNQLLSFRSGLQLKFLFDNGLYLKGGVEYGQIRERFEYRKTTVTDTLLPGQLLEINIDLDGDTTLIIGVGPVEIHEMKNWRVGNNYKSLGINALAGYQIEKGRFYYGIETGIDYNVWFDFDGFLVDAAQNPNLADHYFVSKTKLSLLAAVNMGYKIFPRTSVFANLNYKGNINDINSQSNLVKQKNNLIGVAFGLEISL